MSSIRVLIRYSFLLITLASCAAIAWDKYAVDRSDLMTALFSPVYFISKDSVSAGWVWSVFLAIQLIGTILLLLPKKYNFYRHSALRVLLTVGLFSALALLVLMFLFPNPYAGLNPTLDNLNLLGFMLIIALMVGGIWAANG